MTRFEIPDGVSTAEGGEKYRARARRKRAQYSAFSVEIVRVFVFFAVDLR